MISKTNTSFKLIEKITFHQMLSYYGFFTIAKSDSFIKIDNSRYSTASVFTFYLYKQEGEGGFLIFEPNQYQPINKYELILLLSNSKDFSSLKEEIDKIASHDPQPLDGLNELKPISFNKFLLSFTKFLIPNGKLEDPFILKLYEFYLNRVEYPHLYLKNNYLAFPLYQNNALNNALFINKHSFQYLNENHVESFNMLNQQHDANLCLVSANPNSFINYLDTRSIMPNLILTHVSCSFWTYLHIIDSLDTKVSLLCTDSYHQMDVKPLINVISNGLNYYSDTIDIHYLSSDHIHVSFLIYFKKTLPVNQYFCFQADLKNAIYDFLFKDATDKERIENPYFNIKSFYKNLISIVTPPDNENYKDAQQVFKITIPAKSTLLKCFFDFIVKEFKIVTPIDILITPNQDYRT